MIAIQTIDQQQIENMILFVADLFFKKG